MRTDLQTIAKIVAGHVQLQGEVERIAVARREHAHVDLARNRVAPRALTSDVSSTRSRLVCIAGDMSPTSSSSSVPPSAATNSPGRDVVAPCRRPATTPKSSAASRLSHSAPQLTATNGQCRGVGLAAWMALGDQLLAGAGLAAHQHRHVGRAERAGAMIRRRRCIAGAWPTSASMPADVMALYGQADTAAAA